MSQTKENFGALCAHHLPNMQDERKRWKSLSMSCDARDWCLRGQVTLAHAYRTQIAAFEITGVPRSFVFAAMSSVSPSRQMLVTMVSPGKTTPPKRAW